MFTARFDAFDPSRCSWIRYCQQLKFFLDANKIKDNLKRSTVLTVIGNETFNLLCDLIAPEAPENKSVDEIFQILENHFSPKPIARTERLKLRKRVQEPQETVAEFVAALRRLSVNCNLRGYLEAQIADQFVFGLVNKSTQKRLLAESDDTPLSKLIQIATTDEVTAKDFNSVSRHPDNDAAQQIHLVQQKSRAVKKICIHCGSSHASNFCKFREALCFYCNKKGHIADICRKKQFDKNQYTVKPRQQAVNTTELDTTCASDCDVINKFSIKYTDDTSTQPIMLSLKLNGTPINFELDTGASVSVIPLEIYDKYFKKVKLENTKVKLKTFNHIIDLPIGMIKVDVTMKDITVYNLELIVVKNTALPLLGRSWFKPLGILQNLNINLLSTTGEISTQLNELLLQFKKLFSTELGKIKNFKAHIFIKEGSIPKFFKHRPVPFALLPKIEQELEKLQKQGILEPVKISEWAAPIVPILKKDNSLRICADYKVGVNPCVKIDQHPLPKIDDILFTLARGVIFSKLDMSQAYQQVVLDDISAQYLTINTHKGLFQVTRLPFGIASAPAIFQELMDKILTGTPNTACYLDDILIASPDLKTHLTDLENVFKKLEEVGIHLNEGKCEFLKTEIEYLGHIINNKGIQPSKNKVEAIITAPEPSNSDQLRSFLGLVNYYRKFLANLATMLNPLNALLCKNVKWSWGALEKKAFLEIKQNIASSNLLTHYNPNLPLTVASDASPVGLGAVLSQIAPDGLERPVAFASRTLTTAERKYSQLDKEALGIIFAVRKFHQFLFGRNFTLLTDHKPLTHIFAVDKQIPTLASARIQRWALILAAYSYQIKFRNSKENCNADALSRLPLPDQETSSYEKHEPVLLINQIEDFPCTHIEIAKETSKDPLLSKIVQYVMHGWPEKATTQELTPYLRKKDDISTQENCLLWGTRVIIPLTLRKTILKELHKQHTGIVRMKMLARSLFWWPALDQNIEDIANDCQTCRLHAKDPPKAAIHTWIRPTQPWQRIHADFAGPVGGHTFLVVVDAYSKWPEVTEMTSIDTIHTAHALENHFSHFGYPTQIVTDNGAQFTSTQFAQFCKNRGIHHTLSPPFHPATNGQAERFVQVLKTFLAKMDNFQNLAIKLYELIFAYRTTPLTSTGKAPCELFLGRQLRNRLQLIKPPINPELEGPYNLNLTTKPRTLSEGERVYSRIYPTYPRNKLDERWEVGTVSKQYGPVTYLIKFDDGRLGKRHIDQLRPQRLTQAKPREPKPHPAPTRTYYLRTPSTKPH